MITTAKKAHSHGELRVGWASWDKGNLEKRSFKWAYKDKAGKISRGAPEMPMELLLPFMQFLVDQGEFTKPDLKKMHEVIGNAL